MGKHDLLNIFLSIQHQAQQGTQQSLYIISYRGVDYAALYVLRSIMWK